MDKDGDLIGIMVSIKYGYWEWDIDNGIMIMIVIMIMIMIFIDNGIMIAGQTIWYGILIWIMAIIIGIIWDIMVIQWSIYGMGYWYWYW